MRHVYEDASDIYRGRELQNERAFLLALWQLSDLKDICFVSIDLEGPATGITELGLAFQKRNGPRRAGRHIIVKSTQHLKSHPPKPCGFGLSSEELGEPQDLHAILDDFFTHQRRENCHVVLTGFDIKSDLVKLDRDCNWTPPGDVAILDTAVIFKTFSGKKHHPPLAGALAALGFEEDPSAPFHNAANDAWLALELLFRKAEQALRQFEDLDNKATISWLKPTSTPFSSPVLKSSKLSFPFNRERPASAPKLPYKPASTLGTLTPFSSHPSCQAPQTPSAPHLSRKRKRHRQDQKCASSEALDTPPADSRPEKKRKLVEGSQSNGAAVEEEHMGTSQDLKALEEKERALSDRLALIREKIAARQTIDPPSVT